MIGLFSKWLHDRKPCGYEPIPDELLKSGQLKQGVYWCLHCKTWRLDKPRITDIHLNEMVGGK